METLSWCASGKDTACAADNLEAKLDDIVETAWTKLDRSQIGIPSKEQIMLADGQVKDAEQMFVFLTNEWLYSYPDYAEWAEGENPPYGYWTSTPEDYYDSAFGVYFSSLVGAHKVSGGDEFGVRPVVTLSI